MSEKILIVGFGSIGKRHLRIARELLPEAEIKVLRHQKCSSIPENSNGCFSTIQEAVAFGPKLAVIANPATFHMSIAQPLAEIGTNLLIEKPLSTTTDGVSTLIETCFNHNSILMTGYNLRFLPSLRRFQELLIDNRIGKILSVRCEVGQNLESWRPGSSYQNSVSARKDLGGGALFELSHEIDYLRWIFGEVDWVKALLSTQSNLDVDVEDTVHTILGFNSEYDDTELIGTLNIDFIRHDKTRLCTAIGENGSIRWDGVTGKIDVFEKGAQEWREIFQYDQQRDETYISEWRHFIDCVNMHKAPLISGEDGLIALNIINAIRQSSEYGDKVKVIKNLY